MCTVASAQNIVVCRILCYTGSTYRHDKALTADIISLKPYILYRTYTTCVSVYIYFLPMSTYHFFLWTGSNCRSEPIIVDILVYQCSQIQVAVITKTY